MKKTMIALVALSTMGVAQADITQYDAYFTTGTAGSLTSTLSSGEANIWFGDDEKHLTSWVMEFTLDSTTFTSGWSKNIFASTNRNDAANRPVGLMMWQGLVLGESVGKSHYKTNVTNMITGETQESLSGYSKDSSFPLTLRMAYDAVTQEFYLYDVANNTGLCTSLTGYANLASDLVSGIDGRQSTGSSSIFYSNEAATTTISLGKVWDVQDIAGNKDAFKLFVMTTTPEPATATLSLLALAGLASRRRRH